MLNLKIRNKIEFINQEALRESFKKQGNFSEFAIKLMSKADSSSEENEEWAEAKEYEK